MTPYLADPDVTLYHGDALEVLRQLPDASVDCCVTSPPYWGLRDYGHDGQLGLERTPDEYVARLVELFGEVRRVLRPAGTLWLNLGDTYCNADKWGGGGANTGKHTRTPDGDIASWQAVRRRWQKVDGLKPKDLVGIPWRVAFALQADGWWLRSDIVWSKPNPMPESIKDRPTKSHEYVFLLAKSESYYFGQEDLRERYLDGPGLNGGAYNPPGQSAHGNARGPDGRRVTNVRAADGSIQHRDGERWPNDGRNVRSVWEIPTQPYPGAHFAVFPQKLARRCILGGCPPGGTVLDPFAGSGTTLHVARTLERNAVGIELNADYCRLAAERLQQLSLLAEGAA